MQQGVAVPVIQMMGPFTFAKRTFPTGGWIVLAPNGRRALTKEEFDAEFTTVRPDPEW